MVFSSKLVCSYILHHSVSLVLYAVIYGSIEVYNTDPRWIFCSAEIGRFLEIVSKVRTTKLVRKSKSDADQTPKLFVRRNPRKIFRRKPGFRRKTLVDEIQLVDKQDQYFVTGF